MLKVPKLVWRATGSGQSEAIVNETELKRRRLINWAQTIVVIGGMMLILGLAAHLIFGPGAFLWTAGMVIVFLVFAPRVSPGFVLRLYQAQPIPESRAPQLTALVHELARRAGIAARPSLYYAPIGMLNAFAVGDRDDAAIAVTDGLLRAMSPRELAGILAHEISHIRHNDLRVMRLADAVGRFTSSLSLVGQLLLLINLPLLMTGSVPISWLGVFLLISAPTLSALLQLTLSRTREYQADLGASEITGDPEGLAVALEKLERYQGGWVEHMLSPGQRKPGPSLLRTHPSTEDRVRRLLALREQEGHAHRRDLSQIVDDWDKRAAMHPRIARPPRRRFGGFRF